MLRGEAFDRAIEAFCSGAERERLTPARDLRRGRLRKMLTGVYETLRSAGPAAPARARRARRPGRAPAGAARRCSLLCSTIRGATDNHLAAAKAALDLPSLPETLIDLAALRTRGDRAAGFEEARQERRAGRARAGGDA